MRRSHSVRFLSPLALTAALGAGCSSPLGHDDRALPPAETQALSTAPAASSEIVTTITPLPGGGFRFTTSGVLDVPEGAAWAKIHNFQKLLEIGLPIATDFQWLDGGSPGRVPSRFRFSVLGTVVVEEVFYLDRVDRVLKYRLVVPALGYQSYVGTISLDPVDNTHTRITITRDIVFDDPASVEGAAALFEQEIATLQAYFDRGR